MKMTKNEDNQQKYSDAGVCLSKYTRYVSDHTLYLSYNVR